MSTLLSILLTLSTHSYSVNTDQQPPNIIFVLTDDWGMNDVGWTHHNTETQTTFLDNLAQTESVIFSNYYVERVCSATRAAFLTGRYPSQLGLQSGVFHQNQPFSLTRQASMLSNEFQSNGYATHIIGKWHLGYQSYEYTPTYRGFDTFYGYWNGGESYYTHKSSIHYDTDTGPPLMANDLYMNDNPAIDRNGNTLYTNVYGPWWQRDEALNLLKYYAYNKDTKPFFFFFSLQASHNPREAPAEYIRVYANGQSEGNMDRVTYKAQTHSVDDVMKEVITFMKENGGLWEHSLLVFGSDNGGKKTLGDNAPYRGYKNTSWEGGVKVPMFVTGGYLNGEVKGTTNDYSMHVTDWYQTLLSAAGLQIKYERSAKLYSTPQRDERFVHTKELAIDGIDMWPYIQNKKSANEYFENEREILLDLNEVWCRHSACGALKIGRYKYIRGNNIASLRPEFDGSDWDRSFALNPNTAESFCVRNMDRFSELHSVKYSANMRNSIECQGTDRGCLFDLKLDPCEYYDLSETYPELVQKFQRRLGEFGERSVPALMGENNEKEIVKKEDINPRSVCANPMFWCPYQMYKEVQWEQTLFEDESNQSTLGYGGGHVFGEELNTLLYMCLWLAMAVAMFFVCKHERNRKYGYFASQGNETRSMHELQPLVGH